MGLAGDENGGNQEARCEGVSGLAGIEWPWAMDLPEAPGSDCLGCGLTL